ncbi:RNA-binding proteins (RRM domain) [Blastocystis sp. ATCC 50177/Nand II]|uniref:RNA-binding proteins (RRM domain) n=1 Tax=Blastocystis sp. subtype 1 (strain ATCC 50177 / NandII) TaxID=478820 RepID=A0A196SMD1_BLAHN|nr:RNA-binding proteins (RRM domain) [Blastocystis sp. ATCC 50177/Nand II]
MEEVLVCLADKKAVKKIVGKEVEYKGEMQNQNIGILGAKETEGLQKNELGFELNPPCDSLYGNLLAFLIGENEKPIDLSISHFRRSRKTLRKRQNPTVKEEEPEEKKAEGKNESGSLEVYVEGLPYETTEEQVRSFFEDCGDVVELRMPRYQDSGRCRGYCFIRFDSPDAASKALEKDKATLGTRYITVSLPNERSDAIPIGGKDTVVPLDCRSIFVKNIPYETDEEAIKNLFMRFGKISAVRIPRWNDTGRQKGLCYVDYLKNQSVKLAVAQSGKVELGGRKLLIDVETGKPRSSFRTPEGRLWKNEKENAKRRKL